MRYLVPLDGGTSFGLNVERCQLLAKILPNKYLSYIYYIKESKKKRFSQQHIPVVCWFFWLVFHIPSIKVFKNDLILWLKTKLLQDFHLADETIWRL